MAGADLIRKNQKKLAHLLEKQSELHREYDRQKAEYCRADDERRAREFEMEANCDAPKSQLRFSFSYQQKSGKKSSSAERERDGESTSDLRDWTPSVPRRDPQLHAPQPIREQQYLAPEPVSGDLANSAWPGTQPDSTTAATTTGVKAEPPSTQDLMERRTSPDTSADARDSTHI